MRFASLGSGSKGNATLVESDEALVLVDCGFGLRDALARMALLGIDPTRIDALLVTHEHGDHLRGVRSLAKRLKLPVYLTAGTWLAGKLEGLERVHLINPEQRFAIKDLEIDPVTVPHDAREPVQYLFETAGRRLGVLTDLGHVTDHVRRRFRDCDGLLLECNHDLRMLAEGPYPPSLKRRVGGHWGHLANAQAVALLRHWGTDRLQRVVASHLSDKNNRPELAFEALEPLLDNDASRLMVAAQDRGIGWQRLDRTVERVL
ncbi:MBL fold metallo-hydrolase [Halotalea alkalilenta]|uniref:MBL fold metallo-hydrolase n=1 Tax=Halotalea alkalilenta TaxID=376489 RepID=A0A172YHR8_9GAMM|nr:MBL fold metallo-hydrolase [Halotalea alkalilenta]ANF58800.1 MBL fold metallo-hydrolase [Halotalea alkalilenta]